MSHLSLFRRKNKINEKRWQGCLVSYSLRNLSLENVTTETAGYNIDITMFFIVSHSPESVASVTLSGSALALVTG